MRWTDDQWKAISARDGTLLVSAAAGSGKTAVLVERVLERLEDEENGCDANELLIVTFTKAATAQMREKIAAALQKRIAADPSNARLRRQQALLPFAHISTIDSFCADIVRENFQVLGVEPDYTILDERQLALLQAQSAAEVVEEMYANDADGSFTALTELLFQGRDDRKLIETMQQLDCEASAFISPEDWLRSLYSRYETAGEELDDWQRMCVQIARRIVRTCIETTRTALRIVRSDADVDAKYTPFLTQEMTALEHILSALDSEDWDVLVQTAKDALSELPPRCPTIRGNDSYEKNAAKTVHDDNKERLKKLPKLFCANAAEHLEDKAYCLRCIRKLSEAVLQYRHVLFQKKQAANGYEFSDISLFALQCLRTEDGKRTPYAETLGASFREILVDEFQDVNEAQFELFRLLSRDENNLFMVGDAKQSIYKFRQARPDIFTSLKAKFPLYDEQRNEYPALVLLDRNFRSRSGVTDWVNFVFRQLMFAPKDSGFSYEVNYDEREYLRAAAVYPPDTAADAQLHVLRDENEGEERIVREARYAAKWIRQQLSQGLTVTEDGTTRPATFGDFCILLRSDGGRMAKVAKTLSEYAVPAQAGAQGGFFDTPEIAFMTSLLHVLDNPLQDVPLLAVMLSPVFGFLPDDPASLRVGDRESSLYALLCQAAKDDERYAAFLEKLSRMRTRAVTLSAGDLIRYLLDETGYYAVAGAMLSGESRRANLEQLERIARQYEQSGKIGLSGFCRFLEHLRESGSRVEQAKPALVTANVVQIMTIHRSKGLEFPFVLLLNCIGDFNSEEYRAHYIFHPQYGMATIRRDAETFVQYDTVPKKTLNETVRVSNINEEMRVLYVAMTRAKEKLIMLVSLQNPEKHLMKLSLRAGTDGTVSGATELHNFADMLLCAGLRHPDAHALREAAGMPSGTIMLDDADFRLYTSIADDVREDELPPDDDMLPPPDQQTLAAIRERTRYVYPYAVLAGVTAKHAASEMERQGIDPAHFASGRPAFLSGSGLTPAQRGTLVHRFMQYADYCAASADPEAERDRLVQAGVFTPEESRILPLSSIRRFFDSDLGRRMLSSDTILREKRFTIEVQAHTVYPDLPCEADGETVIIQGMVDCAFVENGSLVIVDYKTDREPPEVLRERYRTQLDVYRLAMGQCTAYPVSQTLLYSFHNHCVVEM